MARNLDGWEMLNGGNDWYVRGVLRTSVIRSIMLVMMVRKRLGRICGRVMLRWNDERSSLEGF